MSITNIHLLQFKFKVTCKNSQLAQCECRYIRIHTKEIPSKTHFYHHSRQLTSFSNYFIDYHPIHLCFWNLLHLFCDKTIICTSNWFIVAQIAQNLEFINFKYVTYKQPFWVSLSSPIPTIISHWPWSYKLHSYQFLPPTQIEYRSDDVTKTFLHFSILIPYIGRTW